MTQVNSHPVLEFGTGGIRGIMGSGSNHMNEQTITRVVQGFCHYIHTVYPSEMKPQLRCSSLVYRSAVSTRHSSRLAAASFPTGISEEKKRGVVIAYDSRNNSPLFAKIAAKIFASNNIPVFMFATLETTPMLSFTIRNLKCIGGICITASHNPPQYNGIKVYWNDGGQIVPPQDEDIIEQINKIPAYFDNFLPSCNEDDDNGDDGDHEGIVTCVPQSVYDAYFQDLLKTIDFWIARTRRGMTATSDRTTISVVYTPLHGTGLKPVTTLLQKLGITEVFVVPEQAQPDGNFPTVKKPNPEEPEALNLAIQYATKRDADIVFATDPDSDRLAVCVKDISKANGVYKTQSKGNYVLLNGNQTAAILIGFILESLKQKEILNKNHKVIKTIVTSALLDEICRAYGVEIFNTPTGFKWIAKLIREWETTHPHYEFIFGAEESFGYMFPNNVRDKDAIAALGYIVQIASYLKSQGKTLCDALFDLFQKFGAWQEDLISFEFEQERGIEKISKIMQHFREAAPTSFHGVAVSQKIDYLNLEKEKNESIFGEKLNVLQFILNDGSQISVRPSGTEPKLKIYLSVCTKVERSKLSTAPTSNLEEVLTQTHDKIKSLRYELLTYVQQSISE